MRLREAVRVVEFEDVVAAAEALLPLGDQAGGDPVWQRVAAPTSWTAAHAVEHVADALVRYAGQVARRAGRRLPMLRDGRVPLCAERAAV